MRNAACLIFHFGCIIHVNGMMAPVKIYDDSYGNSSFCSRNNDNEKGKEHTVNFIRVQVFIEGHKVDVHAVQHQFNGHEHSDQVAPGKQSVHPDKEKRGTYK